MAPRSSIGFFLLQDGAWCKRSAQECTGALLLQLHWRAGSYAAISQRLGTNAGFQPAQNQMKAQACRLKTCFLFAAVVNAFSV